MTQTNKLCQLCPFLPPFPLSRTAFHLRPSRTNKDPTAAQPQPPPGFPQATALGNSNSLSLRAKPQPPAHLPPPVAPLLPPPAALPSRSSAAASRVSATYTPPVKYDMSFATKESQDSRFRVFDSAMKGIGAKFLSSSSASSTTKAGVKLPGNMIPREVLAHIRNVGWKKSDVAMSPDQSYPGNCEIFQGNCNLRGENLLGECFCMPGWKGEECELQDASVDLSECTHTDDRCFWTEKAGIFAISWERWEVAQVSV